VAATGRSIAGSRPNRCGSGGHHHALSGHPPVILTTLSRYFSMESGQRLTATVTGGLLGRVAQKSSDPPGYCQLSNQADGTESSPSRHGRGHAHPALRLSRQSEYSSTLPGAGRRLSRSELRVYRGQRGIRELLHGIVQELLPLLQCHRHSAKSLGRSLKHQKSLFFSRTRLPVGT
jgi:hypothetical protein